MHKLMIALAAITFAVSAQAVSVTWSLGSGTLYNYNPETGGTGDKVGAGATCYLVLDSYMTVIDAQIKKDQNFNSIGVSTALGIVGVGTTGDNGKMSALTVTGLENYKVSAASGAAAIAASQTISWRVLYIDTDNNAWKYSDVNTINTYDESAASVIKTTAKFTSAKFGTSKGTDWQTVPEPTSGLLLALGLMGLALRRKRA